MKTHLAKDYVTIDKVFYNPLGQSRIINVTISYNTFLDWIIESAIQEYES